MTIKKSLLIWAFVSLTVMMTAFYGVFLSKTKVENLLAHGDNLFWSLVQKIPEELEVKVKNGEVAVNKQRPYCLVLTSKLGVYFSNSEVPVLLNESECASLLTVGKNYMVTKEDNGAYKVYKIDPKADYTISKSNIENFYKSSRPIVENVAWVIFYVGPWLGWLVIFGFGLLSCLWYTWVARQALRIFQSKKDLAFVEVFGVSLFLMSMWWFLRYGLIYFVVSFYLKKNMWFGFPFVNTLILTVLALIWYKKWYKKG